jgi:hypothetical protein
MFVTTFRHYKFNLNSTQRNTFLVHQSHVIISVNSDTIKLVGHLSILAKQQVCGVSEIWRCKNYLYSQIVITALQIN